MSNKNIHNNTEAVEARRSVILSFDEDLIVDYQNISELALRRMSDEMFSNLILSQEFPEPLIHTRTMPLDQRCWFAREVFPAVLRAVGVDVRDATDLELVDLDIINIPS